MLCIQKQNNNNTCSEHIKAYICIGARQLIYFLYFVYSIALHSFCLLRAANNRRRRYYIDFNRFIARCCLSFYFFYSFSLSTPLSPSLLRSLSRSMLLCTYYIFSIEFNGIIARYTQLGSLFPNKFLALVVVGEEIILQSSTDDHWYRPIYWYFLVKRPPTWGKYPLRFHWSI